MKTIEAPPSKSVTHRAYILSALCAAATDVVNPLMSQDCEATRVALEHFGVTFVKTEKGYRINGPLVASKSDTLVDLKNAGTGLRFMLAQASRFSHQTTFTGDTSLSRRTSGPLLTFLKSCGVKVSSQNDGLPITIEGPMRPCGDLLIKSGVSSQYASALLFAFAATEMAAEFSLQRPVHSEPYFRLSCQMATQFGVQLEMKETNELISVAIEGGGMYSPGVVRVEADWSSAAFFFVFSMISKQSITIRGLSMQSIQADREVVDILTRLGGQFESTQDAVTFHPGIAKKFDRICVQKCPDLFPVLCILASTLDYPVLIDGAPNLRNKESDRIELMHRGLVALDVESIQTADGLMIKGSRPKPGFVETEGDHRIHMSFRVLARSLGIEVRTDGAGCENVSFPQFERLLSAVERLS